MINGAAEVSLRRYAVVVAIAAVALGLLAFAADSVGGVAGQVVIALTSSGFAWGLAAFLAGRSAAGARRAAAGGTTLLVVATLVYYLLVLTVSRRWSRGVLEDGNPIDLRGLRSVAVMTAVWLIGSMVVGPGLGLLGHVVRVGGVSRAALVTGVTCGLLSGDGWRAMGEARPWRLLVVSEPSQVAFLQGVVVSNLIKIILPVVVLAWLATTQRFWRVWPVLFPATVFSGVLSALLWYGPAAAARHM